jgi:hypothetical protein
MVADDDGYQRQQAVHGWAPAYLAEWTAWPGARRRRAP